MLKIYLENSNEVNINLLIAILTFYTAFFKFGESSNNVEIEILKIIFVATLFVFSLYDFIINFCTIISNNFDLISHVTLCRVTFGIAVNLLITILLNICFIFKLSLWDCISRLVKPSIFLLLIILNVQHLELALLVSSVWASLPESAHYLINFKVNQLLAIFFVRNTFFVVFGGVFMGWIFMPETHAAGLSPKTIANSGSKLLIRSLRGEDPEDICDKFKKLYERYSQQQGDVESKKLVPPGNVRCLDETFSLFKYKVGTDLNNLNSKERGIVRMRLRNELLQRDVQNKMFMESLLLPTKHPSILTSDFNTEFFLPENKAKAAVKSDCYNFYKRKK